MKNIIFSQATKEIALGMISQFAEKKISEQDRQKFIEVVDTELLALHEGSIAKFKIKPDEFQAWQDVWIEK